MTSSSSDSPVPCRVIAFVITVVGVLAIAHPVSAEFQLGFGQSGVPGQTNFFANPGETLDLEIYLTQSGGETRLTTEGLAGFQFNLNLTGNGSVFIPNPAPFVAAPGLDTGVFINRVSGVEASFAGGAPPDPNDFFLVLPAFPPLGSDSILLGQTTLTLSALASGDYDVTASIFDVFSFPIGPDPFFGELIAPLPGTARISVAAIPEPSSLLALSVIGAAGTWHRRRRMAKKS